MALKKIDPSQTEAWMKLQDHFQKIENTHMMDWFKSDPERANRLSIKWEDFYIDYSKNRIISETLDLLLEFANEMNLKDAIKRYYEGDIINETEGRAVLHTALRAKSADNFEASDSTIFEAVSAVREKMAEFSESVISGERKGQTNKVFTDVVNIGIGGSDLGPAMVVDALTYYQNHLNVHFISNVDGDHVSEVIKDLNPETTLFVIVSKTFTTQETLSNAQTIREWFVDKLSQEAVSKHFVAVSTNINKVKEFGIEEDNIFPMWNWVGGRFSLWSAVGLSINLAVGTNNFNQLLEGAYKMDDHFQNTEFDQNIPVILGLIGLWYTNFFGAETEAIIPYSQYLNQFATYLQQAIMESNGKSVDRFGNTVNYQTGNVVWGEPGTNSQHAFFQLIHQGTKLIPADFIGFAKSLHGKKDHQDKLMSNFMAQTEALLNGKSLNEARQELIESGASEATISAIAPFKVFEGNKPTNTIFIHKLSPESLGKLIAMYEHKIFVHGILWNIYSYDQFGVELGKQLAGKILKEFALTSIKEHDGSTSNLIEFYKKLT